MKCLTLFVDGRVLEDLLDRLRSDPDVTGFTVGPCEGHSLKGTKHSGETLRDRVVGYVPRMRIELVLQDDIAPAVLARLRAGVGEGESLGTYTLVDVEQWGSI